MQHQEFRNQALNVTPPTILIPQKIIKYLFVFKIRLDIPRTKVDISDTSTDIFHKILLTQRSRNPLEYE